MSFTDEQYHLIVVSARIGGCLSLLGTAAVVVSSLLNREKTVKSAASRLILNLSIADFLSAITFVINRSGFTLYGGDSSLCIFLGFLQEFSLLAGVTWTGAIAVNLWLSTVKQKNRAELISYEKYYHLLCWVGTFLWSAVLLLPFLQYKDGLPFYGAADLWCWISPDYLIFRLAWFYLPLWIFFTLIVVIYVWVGVIVVKSTRRLSSGLDTDPTGQSRELAKLKRRYFMRSNLYLLIFLISWVPASINRLVVIADPTQKIFTLALLQAILEPINGFMNALVYFWSGILRRFFGKNGKKNVLLGQGHGTSSAVSLTTSTMMKRPPPSSSAALPLSSFSPSSASSFSSPSCHHTEILVSTKTDDNEEPMKQPVNAFIRSARGAGLMLLMEKDSSRRHRGVGFSKDNSFCGSTEDGDYQTTGFRGKKGNASIAGQCVDLQSFRPERADVFAPPAFTFLDIERAKKEEASGGNRDEDGEMRGEVENEQQIFSAASSSSNSSSDVFSYRDSAEDDAVFLESGIEGGGGQSHFHGAEEGNREKGASGPEAAALVQVQDPKRKKLRTLMRKTIRM